MSKAVLLGDKILCIKEIYYPSERIYYILKFLNYRYYSSHNKRGWRLVNSSKWNSILDVVYDIQNYYMQFVFDIDYLVDLTNRIIINNKCKNKRCNLVDFELSKKDRKLILIF